MRVRVRIRVRIRAGVRVRVRVGALLLRGVVFDPVDDHLDDLAARQRQMHWGARADLGEHEREVAWLGLGAGLGLVLVLGLGLGLSLGPNPNPNPNPNPIPKREVADAVDLAL